MKDWYFYTTRLWRDTVASVRPTHRMIHGSGTIAAAAGTNIEAEKSTISEKKFLAEYIVLNVSFKNIH